MYTILKKGNHFFELDYHINVSKKILGDKFKVDIVGNKNDLFLNEEIKEEEGKNLAEKNGYKFKLISA